MKYLFKVCKEEGILQNIHEIDFHQFVSGNKIFETKDGKLK